MDRPMLERHDELAKNHVSQGEGHIGRQKEIIVELERDRHSTTIARRTLAVFEATQAMHIEDLLHIERELGM